MPEVRRGGRTIAILVAVWLLGALMGVAGGFVASAAVRGELSLYDEWVCSRDEAPASGPDGGSFCAPLDGSLPPGATWDPLGNRPFDCDGRDGWVVIESRRTQEIECYRDYTPLPDGWRLVP